jgi:phage shock protein PspC (stress-responsive transcriptional regulator)
LFPDVSSGFSPHAVDMDHTTGSAKPLHGFEDTVKDFWVSRPRRPHHGRKVAGVAAGIGNRYGIDPTVVRVAFVVLTVLGGIGVALYLLGVLLFAEGDDPVSGMESLFGKGHSSMAKSTVIVLCVVLLPVALWTFADHTWMDGGTFVGLALVAGSLYLLHRSRGQYRRPAPTGVRTDTAAMGTAATGAGGAPVSQAVVTWDPLGADPLGWRLPGAALAAEGVPWFTPAHVVGLMLGVLGLGMVVGAFFGGSRGLVWLALPLAMAGLVLTTIPSEHLRGGFGNLVARPTSAEQVLPVYARTAGNVHLDLRELSGDDRVTTTVRTGAGPVTVQVPADADVWYTCSARVGTLDCLGRSQTGLNPPALRGHDYGVDGEGGPHITLTAEAGAGPVEVIRG